MNLPSLGEQEHLVLQAVWQLGRCTVRQVFEAVGEPRGVAYTTVATMLDRLYRKGLLARERRGNALLYEARVKQELVERQRAKTALTRLLGSVPEPAIAALVDAVETLDPELLDELARVVAARRRSRRGS